jgi:hypothetical protein
MTSPEDIGADWLGFRFLASFAGLRPFVVASGSFLSVGPTYQTKSASQGARARSHCRGDANPGFARALRRWWVSRRENWFLCESVTKLVCGLPSERASELKRINLDRAKLQRNLRRPPPSLAAARLLPVRSARAAKATRRHGQRWWNWPASCAVPTQIVGRSPCGRSRPPLPSAAMWHRPASRTKLRP